MQTEVGQVVFVCYVTNKISGIQEVVIVLEEIEDVEEFICEQNKNHSSWEVKPFVVESVGSSMARAVPIWVQLLVPEN